MLKLYGIPNSQPVRAVMWLCLMHRLPFEFILTSQNKDAKSAEYLSSINPRGTVPAIDDAGVVLWESAAIMIYLCEKHGWHDYWPQDLDARARVNQYLHFHHRNTRELVITWSQTLWPSVFGVGDPSPEWLERNTFPGMQNNAEICRNTLSIIEGWLADDRWIADTKQPSIADIAAYEELGQNQPKYANCTDYSAYPAIENWLKRMGKLPEHDVAHDIWQQLGDINTLEGGMKTVARANKVAAATVTARVQRFSSS